MDREKAYQLLKKYTKKEALMKHARGVEEVMRAYARKFNEDEDSWGIVGLLHDFEYDMYPEEHPQKGSVILRKEGYPEEWIEAILAHDPRTGAPRKTMMAKALFASDELTGLITAVALIRPSKKIRDVKVKSVKKKFKEKKFAAGVNRDDIKVGASELGVTIEEHIKFVLETMQSIADEID